MKKSQSSEEVERLNRMNTDEFWGNVLAIEETVSGNHVPYESLKRPLFQKSACFVSEYVRKKLEELPIDQLQKIAAKAWEKGDLPTNNLALTAINKKRAKFSSKGFKKQVDNDGLTYVGSDYLWDPLDEDY